MIWAIRDWFLSGDLQYRGYEWVLLFLGIAYLWLILRAGLLDEGRGIGPRRVTGPDTSVAILTALVIGILVVAG